MLIIAITIVGIFPDQNLGYTFLEWAGDVILVYLIIDILLLRDDRRRWNDVKDRVLDLVRGELTGILIDVNSVTGAGIAPITLPRNASEEEEKTAYNKAILKEMKELSTDLDLLKKEVDPHLLRGDFGTLFSDRAKSLGDLQLKYWSKFLEPRQMALIIDLQRLLESLDTHISITKKYKQWGKKSELSKWTGETFERLVYNDLANLLTVLSQNIDMGMIEMW